MKPGYNTWDRRLPGAALMGSDPEIAKLFAHAEQKRNFCGQRDPLLYATPKRPADAVPRWPSPTCCAWR